MNDYLLLTDRKQCPKCLRLAAPTNLPALCRNCGMHLFKSTDNLAAFVADTGWREYWVWTGTEEGWKHSTQLDAPNPLHRVVEIPKLPDNYGTQEFIDQKIADTRKELKEELKRKRKGTVISTSKLP